MTPQVVRGTPASPGAAIGPAWTRSETVPPGAGGPPEAEAERARRGLELAADELGALAAARSRGEGHAGDAEIVEANQLMAQDPTLVEAAAERGAGGRDGARGDRAARSSRTPRRSRSSTTRCSRRARPTCTRSRAAPASSARAARASLRPAPS